MLPRNCLYCVAQSHILGDTCSSSILADCPWPAHLHIHIPPVATINSIIVPSLQPFNKLIALGNVLPCSCLQGVTIMARGPKRLIQTTVNTGHRMLPSPTAEGHLCVLAFCAVQDVTALALGPKTLDKLLQLLRPRPHAAIVAMSYNSRAHFCACCACCDVQDATALALGPKTTEKLLELLNTGHLWRTEVLEGSERNQTLALFCGWVQGFRQTLCTCRVRHTCTPPR